MWERFNRPVPTWFTDAKLGIFVSWGAFSVPAWAEPIGELGTVDDSLFWFTITLMRSGISTPFVSKDLRQPSTIKNSIGICPMTIF